MKTVGTAIIGGGIVGVALAYYLAASGETDVEVVERDELGSGATAGSFGGVRQQFSTPQTVELAMRGRRFWETFESVFDAPCAYHRDGYLLVTGDQRKYEALVEAAQVQRAAGADEVHIVEAESLRTIVPWLSPEGLIAGSWTPNDGRINPTDGLQGIVSAARRLGVKFTRQHAVAEVQRTPAGWLLVTPEPIVAQRVIIAAGLGTPELTRPFGLDLPITPMKVHSAITTPVLLDQRLPLTIDLDTGLEIERDQDGACITIVSGRSPEDYSVTDMMQEFAEAASVRAPIFSDVGIRTTYTAYADATGGDGQPFAGRVSDDLWVLSGFDAHGTMMGPSFAEFLVDVIAGRNESGVDASVYDPWRTPTTVEWMRSGSH